ncbi:Ig-like domain-containing protein [Microcystis aeruginosa CS-563/04]|uniref:Ig-like domain-containing protein n=1 Tax=Microcystis aeruginosa TaxID=1126 RepID=UPI00232B6921|nr:Ig-like domain-containing protein [Microcystis aeruginosa]MDB9421097.1 Ig-like domain-containing protein [Microcystis aeruginosa CS-563/04]
MSAGDIFISGNSTTPSIKITAPSTNVSDTEVTIEWNAFDADSEATISLFYDTDNQGFDGVLIADGLAETDGQGSFVWNTENIPLKDYFIYAQISDETHSPVFSYAKGQVQLKPVVEADLSVTKTASISSVELGETFTYTIQVTNNGSVTAQGVTITEILQEPVTFVSASLTPSQQSDNAFTFDIGDLPSGESQIIEVMAIAPTLLTGTIISNTSVSSETNDPDLTNNVALLATEVTATALPDLVVTRTDSSGEVNINTPYNYTLTVTNNGSATATGVILTEQLPSTVDVISFSSNLPEQPSNLVDIIKFELDAGERVILDLDAQELGSPLDSVLRLFDSAWNELAENDIDFGTPFPLDSYIDFTASVSGTYCVGVSGWSNLFYDPFIDGSGDSSSSYGDYTLEIKVGSGGSTNQVVLSEPNNIISQAVDSGLSSANQGIFIGTGSIRTDTNPITFFNGIIAADVGTLSSGESATIDLTLSSIAAGNLNSTTIVTGNESDANPLDNLIAGTQAVNSIAPAEIDLELTQTVNNSNPAIGDEITLTLTLANIGPGVASNIQVTNVLPLDLAFISVVTEQGTYDSNTGIWDVGNMRDNLSRTLTITAQVNGGQSLTNTAQVTAVFEADLDSIPNNNDPNEDDQTSVLIDVQNVAPIVQVNKTLTVLEDASSTSLNISTPTDGNDDSLTLTVEIIPDGTKGQIFSGNNLVNTGDVLTPQQLTSLVFVPIANANGTAGTFSYTVSDGQGGTTSQTITLAITSVNDAPVAQADTATTAQNTPLTLDILANDSDIEGDSLSLTSFNQTSSQGGTVSRDENGTQGDLTDDKLLYTPATGFSGIDSFTYTISDGTDSGTATVSITVISTTNQPPQAVNDGATGTQNTLLIIPVATLLSNDTDPDLGDSLNLTGVSNPSNGSVELDGSNVIFTPLAGFIGQAGFDYSISDSQGETSTASVDIAIDPFLGTPGRDTVTGTDLDDILMGGLGADNLTGNQGHDQFVYQSIRDAGDVIKDFEVGIDYIVFTALLNSLGYGGSNPIADGYLKFGSRGNDTVILFDEDGSGLSKRALPFITVEGVALAAMQNPNNFIF